MQVQILFFANLRELSGVNEKRVDAEVGMSVADLWQRLSTGIDSLPTKVLCAVNQEYVDHDYLLKEGDLEVAFFPPVTGG